VLDDDLQNVQLLMQAGVPMQLWGVKKHAAGGTPARVTVSYAASGAEAQWQRERACMSPGRTTAVAAGA
jgi:hypothetical protein